MTDEFIRHAKVVQVNDGDTIDVLIDCGFDVWASIELRLLDVFAFETKGTKKDLGLSDKEALAKTLPVGTEIDVQTYKTKNGKYKKSFTRYIAEIFLNGESVNKKLKEREQGGIGFKAK